MSLMYSLLYTWYTNIANILDILLISANIANMQDNSQLPAEILHTCSACRQAWEALEQSPCMILCNLVWCPRRKWLENGVELSELRGSLSVQSIFILFNPPNIRYTVLYRLYCVIPVIPVILVILLYTALYCLYHIHHIHIIHKTHIIPQYTTIYHIYQRIPAYSTISPQYTSDRQWHLWIKAITTIITSPKHFLQTFHSSQSQLSCIAMHSSSSSSCFRSVVHFHQFSQFWFKVAQQIEDV